MPHLPHGMHVIQLEGIDDKQAGWGGQRVQSDVVPYGTLSGSCRLVFSSRG